MMNTIQLQSWLNGLKSIPKPHKWERSLMDIMGVTHHENMWSDIYKFFLHEEESHHLNDLFIRSLEQLLGRITDSSVSDNWLLTANLDDIAPAMGHCNGMEIASWLADYTKNDVRYVIIDDEYVCLESQVPHFILTNPYDGITEDIADRVIAILEQ